MHDVAHTIGWPVSLSELYWFITAGVCSKPYLAFEDSSGPPENLKTKWNQNKLFYSIS